MIGIKSIGSYLPSSRVSNLERMEEFSIDEEFIEDKIGIRSLAREKKLSVTEMCCRAYEDLFSKKSVSIDNVDCIVLCTQNGGGKLPHTSTYIQKKLGASKDCAVFDLSLGCSGYVYGLSIMKAFMNENGLSCGLFFTCDPYSSILEPSDKNTELLFGDAATVTLLTDDPLFEIKKCAFYNDGEMAPALTVKENGKLYMDGRSVFNFVLRYAPGNIKKCLEVNKVRTDEIDLYLFHQGSKFIVESLAKRLALDLSKVPFMCAEYGNTISSSIPLMLQHYLNNNNSAILLSGFGVGLGAATIILKRVK